MPTALLSVSDKTGLLPLARALAASGYRLVSTGGTAKALEAAEVPIDNPGYPSISSGGTAVFLGASVTVSL